MIYIGMDVSSKEFMVHAINEKKKIKFKGGIEPTRRGLRKMIKSLGEESKLVVFEAGNQLKWIAMTLKAIEGVTVHVVHPNEIKWISQSSGKTDKIDAKKVAKAVGIPVLPGSRRTRNVKDALECAKKLGYPVMIKSCFGGGGRGMRRLDNRRNVKKDFDSAVREVCSGFGSRDVFCEKFVPGRHIEFQFLADSHGNVVHLFERECSIQRRFQKLVEEAPSTLLDSRLREKMGALACSFAQRVGYVGAGTVEFLVTKDRKFYFLELNPRIQVEHGIRVGEPVKSIVELPGIAHAVGVGIARDIGYHKIVADRAELPVRSCLS